MLQKDIEKRLAQYQDPYLAMDLVAANAVKQVTVMPDRVVIEISLGYPHERLKAQIINTLEALLLPVVEGKTLEIKLLTQIDAHTGNANIAPLPQVKNIIAVASGKGGVGKSTVAVNLALALAKEGAQVGMLDADIYGPSQPTLLGAIGEKPIIRDKSIEPISRYGIQSMSIGYLVDNKATLAWRGPMLGKALEQLTHDTVWKGLDYLIVDLPPGTGDIQLTLCQKIPVSGAVIVTTPQELALVDVTRACEMFNKLNVPMLGVVENMSIYHCPACGHEEAIFGEGGGALLSKQYNLPLLGAIPLNKDIQVMTDTGHPPVVAAPDSAYTNVFNEIARKVSAKLAGLPKSYKNKFPNIVVERNK